MRAVVQRVTSASASPGGAIGQGVCVLLGIARDDDDAAAERLAGKIARLRIFENEDGKFDRSLLDIGRLGARRQPVHAHRGHAQKGNRPSFTDAAPPEVAEPLYEAFCAGAAKRSVSRWSEAFSAPAWPSSSSTTAR